MQSTSSITPQLLVLTDHSDHGEAALSQLRGVEEWRDVVLPNADVLVINPEGEGIAIETVRELIQNSGFAPYQKAERAVLLLHLEQASAPAQQALLKLLEEPPHYLRIIATTGQVNAVLPTIQSRCEVVLVKGKKEVEIEEEVRTIYQRLSSLTPKEVIKISETYKEQSVAQGLLTQLIFLTHQDPAFPSPTLTNQLKVLSQHLERLGQNANVRLTVENCFFCLLP